MEGATRHIRAKAHDLCTAPDSRYRLPEGHPVIKRVEQAIWAYYEAGNTIWTAIKRYHHVTGIPIAEYMLYNDEDFPLVTSYPYTSQTGKSESRLHQEALKCILDADRIQLRLTEKYRHDSASELITFDEAQKIKHALEKDPASYPTLIAKLENRPHHVMKDGKIIADGKKFHHALNEDLLGGAIKRAIDTAIENDNFSFIVFHHPEIKLKQLNNMIRQLEGELPPDSDTLKQEIAQYLYHRYQHDFSFARGKSIGSAAMNALKHIGEGKDISYHEERLARQLSLQPHFKECVAEEDTQLFHFLNHLLDRNTQLGSWLQRTLKPEKASSTPCLAR